MTKHILLFGGAFDPPHLGHQLVIEKALELVNPDELWVMPAYNHSFDKKMTSAEDRVGMCKRLLIEVRGTRYEVRGKEKIKLCTVEIERRSNGSTYDTWQFLVSNIEHRTSHFSFLMGSDQLLHFREWQHWQELLKEIQFYVYPRRNFSMQPWFGEMKKLESEEISDVSSTEVRERLRQGKLIDDLVPEEVEKYIREQNLYKL